MRRNIRPRPQLVEARQKGFFNIGQAAKASAVSAKMIRHYEQIGLVKRAARTFANYRIYTSDDVHTLLFIKRARKVGFSIKQITELLSLWQNTRRSSAQVKHLAHAHILELETRIAEMRSMAGTLKSLVERCSGDHRPSCPILDGLALNDADAKRRHDELDPRSAS